MHIRTANAADLDAVTAVEAAGFPPSEAATRQSLCARLAAYPNHFWLLETNDNPEILSFVNGLCTDTPNLADEMYADAALHSESGAWQMIFGVVTAPQYRGRGYAATLLRQVIADAKAQGRKGLVLTCKARLLPFYAALGFADEGVSASEHGGVVWHQMRLTF